MNDATAMARRYHWLGETVESFVSEPHAAVCCDAKAETLNLVASESGPVREASAALAARPTEVLSALEKVPTLELPRRHHVAPTADIDPRYLRKILLKTYERVPADFEALLGIEGVGAKTLRALALAAELIYGSSASTRDPARFSFAHGGKDGHPYPVDRETYDRTIEILGAALKRARVDRSEKVAAWRRLAAFAGPVDSLMGSSRSAVSDGLA
jgi:hypothetical protein